MKAILVIDMPNCCWECQLEHFGLCMGSTERKTIKDMNVVPKWCPLKKIPMKKDTARDKSYSIEDYRIGWNDCIEELEK